MQRHHVGGGQQFPQRHRSCAQSLHGSDVAGRRIVKTDAATHALEGVGDRGSDGAKPDHADQQALQSREVVGKHAGAEIHVMALADLAIRPGHAAQQHRGRGDGIFCDRAVACAGNVGDRNAEPRQRGLVEPVETGAGDLDEAQAAAFEQGGRKLRTDGGNDQRGRGLHALRQRRVVRLGVAYLERRRRQRIDAREIGFRPQAENV